MHQRKSTKLIHEGKYAAEVEIELHYSDESWDYGAITITRLRRLR